MHDSDTGAAMEMPRYVSHKKVWALEISTVNRTTPGKVVLSFKDKGYAALTFNDNDLLFARYMPIQGDFYVVYADGYKSFSPRNAFLEGYTRELPPGSVALTCELPPALKSLTFDELLGVNYLPGARAG